MLLFLQQNPIVVEVLQQPEATPDLTFGEIILGAIGFTGMVMVLAVVTGLLAGGIIIFLKKRFDANAPPTDPGHARLRI